jgi:hypothetical protein
VRDYITSMHFKPYCFLIKSRLDTYIGSGGDENKLRYMVVRTFPFDLKEENQMLLRRLALYSGKD